MNVRKRTFGKYLRDADALMAGAGRRGATQEPHGDRPWADAANALLGKPQSGCGCSKSGSRVTAGPRASRQAVAMTGAASSDCGCKNRGDGGMSRAAVRDRNQSARHDQELESESERALPIRGSDVEYNAAAHRGDRMNGTGLLGRLPTKSTRSLAGSHESRSVSQRGDTAPRIYSLRDEELEHFATMTRGEDRDYGCGSPQFVGSLPHLDRPTARFGPLHAGVEPSWLGEKALAPGNQNPGKKQPVLPNHPGKPKPAGLPPRGGSGAECTKVYENAGSWRFRVKKGDCLGTQRERLRRAFRLAEIYGGTAFSFVKWMMTLSPAKLEKAWYFGYGGPEINKKSAYDPSPRAWFGNLQILRDQPGGIESVLFGLKHVYREATNRLRGNWCDRDYIVSIKCEQTDKQYAAKHDRYGKLIVAKYFWDRSNRNPNNKALEYTKFFRGDWDIPWSDGAILPGDDFYDHLYKTGAQMLHEM